MVCASLPSSSCCVWVGVVVREAESVWRQESGWKGGWREAEKCCPIADSLQRHSPRPVPDNACTDSTSSDDDQRRQRRRPRGAGGAGPVGTAGWSKKGILFFQLILIIIIHVILSPQMPQAQAQHNQNQATSQPPRVPRQAHKRTLSCP